MLIKNIEILFYTIQGQGAGKYKDKIVYINNVIKGEVVDANLFFETKNYAKARLIGINKKSPNRVEFVPKEAPLIGGYELIHMNDEEQAIFKQEQVKIAFKQNAKYTIDLIDIFQGKKRFFYRNKLVLNDNSLLIKNTHHKIKIKDFVLSDIYKKSLDLKGKVIYRNLDTFIYGYKDDNKYTYDNLLSFKFRVGISSFYQVNKEVTEAIYKEILDNIDNQDHVLDLYSGIGTISLLVASKAKEVSAVEWNTKSYIDALYNQKINKIQNVTFYNEDVYLFVQKNSIESFDTVILDPSREGVQKEVLEAIIKNKISNVIYLSCNPATQARDFNILKDYYEIKFIKIYDMFPQTYHIENLMILKYKK